MNAAVVGVGARGRERRCHVLTTDEAPGGEAPIGPGLCPLDLASCDLMDRYVLIDPANGLAGADDDRRREEFELFDPDEPTGDVRILRGRPLRGAGVDPAQNEPRDRDAERDVSTGSHVRKTEETVVLIPGEATPTARPFWPSSLSRG